MELVFEWDPRKDRANQKKHGISSSRKRPGSLAIRWLRFLPMEITRTGRVRTAGNNQGAERL